MECSCPVCGPVEADAGALQCPNCSSALAAHTESQAENTGRGFPIRKNLSFSDSIKIEQEKRRHNWGIVGSIQLLDTWSSELANRPLDIPWYTAVKDVAHIAVLVSRRSIDTESVLDGIGSDVSFFQLHARGFLEGGYPILRMNLFVPDNLAAPLCLESPLDIRDGDVQDFISATQKDERVRIIIGHEASPNFVRAWEAKSPKVGYLLAEETRRILERPLAGGENEFRRSVAAMERSFARATDGIDNGRIIRLFASRCPNSALVF